MNRVATLSERERNELFSLTAERRGMGSIAVVEKDFWVCWTLKQLFEHPELSKQLIFKGGTSLSKVYGLIDRFSEDVDLVLDWRVVDEVQDPMGERTKTKQRQVNEALNEKARAYIAETMLPRLEEALGEHCELEVKPEEKDQGHVVRVRYPKTTKTEGLLPYIQLEIGPLASWLPHSEHTITPYAAETFPDQFEAPQCIVRAIDAERTFWEKATILHHEAHRPQDSVIPERYSRHYYDLCLMATDEALKASALGKLELLDDVVRFKKKFYPRGWANYDAAKPGTLKLIPPDHVLEEMRKDYLAMREMIFGRCPAFDEMIAALAVLESEINHP
ncbi:MAG: nucleotidyl transferase AbiEii/AbiGii toxin family protein [Verrucomicrobiales bacterium]|nr:nucleotidyl transferase AbiEii/AbiGii toxin family protein [Verrucomicrobiales bacterium]HQZ28349.1 nucleotidyl transferase AbiEii/AbiGii toxin family protein [Verrucomicrobiales bacterium]